MPEEGRRRRRRRRAAAGLALLMTTTAHATRSRPNLRNGAADSNGRGRRDLSAQAYCGSNWQDAFDTCNQECEQGNDSQCGPGRYCFGYVGCTPPQPEPEPYAEPIVPSNFSPAASPGGQPSPSVPSYTAGTPSPNYMPAYIASLPVRPSEPTTPAPFVLPPPTMNMKANPTNNFCGYGWEQ